MGIGKGSGKGGKRPGAGRPRKLATPPKDADLAARRAEAERLYLFFAPEALRRLIQSALDGDTPAAKYIADRVFGRPRESDKLQGEDESTRRELALLEARRQIEYLEERTRLARLLREREERRQAPAAASSRVEGRLYPSGGPGLGPCGRYHAALDGEAYPGSPWLVRGAELAGAELCPLCGEAPPPPPVAPAAGPAAMGATDAADLPGILSILDDD